MHEEELMRIGLSRKEAEVYLTLLELGPSLVGSIAKRSEVNRTNIYDLLKRLGEKGLVAHVVKSGRKTYNAVEPKKLLRYLDERAQKIEEERDRIGKLLPALALLRPDGGDETVEVYEGKEGIKTVLDDILATRATAYTYGTDRNFSRVIQFYFTRYLKRFEKLGRKMYVVFSGEVHRPFPWKFAHVRYIPKKYASPTETTIYGTTVAIFIFTAQPRVVLIRSASVAAAYKRYFDILWRAGRE